MKRTMGVVGLLPALLLAGCAIQPPAKSDPVRRVITVSDGTDGALVLADGPSANAVTLNGTRINRLWETGKLPVPLVVDNDAGATAGNAYREGFVGSSLYTADIPPGSDLSDIPLHAQDSLDYIAVLSGQIDLVLPEKRVRLETGDVLIQAGNMHSWVNTSDELCRILVVVLTGTR